MRTSRQKRNLGLMPQTLKTVASIIQSVMLIVCGYFVRDMGITTPPSLEKDGLLADARDPLSSHLKESNSMDWIIPEDILKERHNKCEGKKISSTGGFCLTKQTVIGGNNWVDIPLGEYLRDNLFRDKTVVDLGAGLGHYGKIFTAENSPVKSWVGFDGAMNVQNAIVEYVNFVCPSGRK